GCDEIPVARALDSGSRRTDAENAAAATGRRAVPPRQAAVYADCDAAIELRCECRDPSSGPRGPAAADWPASRSVRRRRLGILKCRAATSGSTSARRTGLAIVERCAATTTINLLRAAVPLAALGETSAGSAT